MHAFILQKRLYRVKEKFKIRAKSIAQHSATKKILKDMKPEKSLWGIIGVLFFFILPEVIAYFYAEDITRFAKSALTEVPTLPEKYLYDLLIMLFEEGVSWLNFGIGIILLIWLFF